MQQANYCLVSLIVAVVTSTEIRFCDVFCVHHKRQGIDHTMTLFVIEVGPQCESMNDLKDPKGA